MSIGSKEYAALSQDSYIDQSGQVGQKVSVQGVEYKILDTYNDPVTGYQGTAYRRADTGEVVIAHRGTEKDGRDWATDAGMVLAGVNVQVPDAEAFTQRVLEKAKLASEQDGKPLSVTVTGHSLGGTLAEDTAYKFHLHGETFNAYGAAGLLHDVPKGGSQVVNHVRATDVVGAASAHFGEVRVYATAQDMTTLSHSGYRNDGGVLSARNPFTAVDLGAHSIGNFVPDAQGHSAFDAENVARYRANHTLIDRYREDVQTMRTIVSASWELPHAAVSVGEAAGKAGVHAAVHTGHAIVDEAQRAGHAVSHGAQVFEHQAAVAATVIGAGVSQAGHGIAAGVKTTEAAISHGVDAAGKAINDGVHTVGDGASKAWDTLTHPRDWLEKSSPLPARLDDPGHPGHAFFQQSLHGIDRLNGEHGVAPSPRDANIAGAVAVEAAVNGLSRIDHVALSVDASKVIAMQTNGDVRYDKYAAVDTVTAINTPLEHSSAQWSQAAEQRQQAVVQQRQRQVISQSAPSMTV